MKAFPFPITALKFRASARHRPARMSGRAAPCCWRWIMSDFAKTVHRPAIRAGSTDCSASSENSSSMAMPSRSACWSRNAPVPAAHNAFMAKSRSRSAPVAGSRSSDSSLLSCPPISITVRVSG